MKIHQWLYLYVISLVVLILTSALTPAPGYMDADYYYTGGRNIVEERDFQEQYIWNFLDNPTGLPVPAFTYWMPLPSLLAALGMFFTNQNSFWFARIPFIILAAGIAPLTGWFAYSLSKNSIQAWTGGLLAAVSGFYLPYLSTTSTFTPAMLLGSGYIIAGACLFKETLLERRWILPVFFGVVCGLLHLNRADGFIWLILAVGLITLASIQQKEGFKRILRVVSLLLVGYAVVTGAWYIRNLNEFGGLFPPGSNRPAWLTNYDELFILNATILTPARWLESGIRAILDARLQAFGQNLVRAAAVQGEIFLVPLILLGAWRMRRNIKVSLAGIVWFITFTLMTVIFPFAGMRGGFFHSGAMVQPVLWALVPTGLESAVAWGAKKRGWQMDQALRTFSIGTVLISTLVTSMVFFTRSTENAGWASSADRYKDVDELLTSLDVPISETILVNNPPGLFGATHRPAIVIPYGGLEETRKAAIQYHVNYLLLDSSNSAYLDDLYKDLDGTENFLPIGQAGEMRLYQISP